MAQNPRKKGQDDEEAAYEAERAESPEQKPYVLPRECIINGENNAETHDPEAQVVQRSQSPNQGHGSGIEQEGKSVNKDEGEQEQILRRKGRPFPFGVLAEDCLDEDEESQKMENKEPDTQDIPQGNEDNAES